MQALGVGLLAAAVVAIPADPALADYPLVNILNETKYAAYGKVAYASFRCLDDNFSVAPGTSWTASSRGVCLVTEVSANVNRSIACC